MDELWGDDPPPGARKLVSGYVLRLRRLAADPDGQVLVTQAPGYRIVASRTDLDACQFEHLLTVGRTALENDDAGRAAELLSEALALWRGPALADVPRGPLAAAEADRLDELHLTGTELRIEARICCGQSAELVPELCGLTARHPLRERFWHQLMRALAGCGRTAEALAVYGHVRDLIADELGAHPGPQLQQLHYRILTGHPSSAGHPPLTGRRPHAGQPAAAVTASSAVPRELPATVQQFVGRGEELERLSTFLDEATGAGGAIVISAIGGTAGVGKTALAVHWAHQVSGRFPGGQLYVNLRGYDPAQPMTAADALAGFLRALGMPGRDIPAEEGERAARYRSMLAGKRMLVILDNAGSVEQVRPLLPGTSGCAVVLTSRDSLAGLVARDGAQRLDLDLLPLADAVGLLQALIGARVDADPEAAAALAGQCCRLPLALRVAAELAAARPDVAIAGLVGELADRQRRLDLLDAGGDPRTAVRAVFSWSCRQLDADTARTFRLAGLHPGPNIDPYAVAALTGTTAERAGHLLYMLTRAQLIQPAGPGRYSMHDLQRAYARELAAARDREEELRAALTGLFDHYLHTAAAAMDTLFPAEQHLRPRVHTPDTPAPPVAEPVTARAWLDAERVNLVAVAAHAACHGWPGHATRLAATLFRYLDEGDYYPEAITVYTHACRAAHDTGDRTAEADALTSLGVVNHQQARYGRAIDYLQTALALRRETGDQVGEARTLGSLGLVDERQGRYQQAARNHQQALTLFRQAGDRTGEARTLGNLGIVRQLQGRYQQAADYHQQALTLHRQTGDRTAEARTLANLGDIDIRQGRYQQAADRQQQAQALCRETGDRQGLAHALVNLGDAGLRQGHYRQAADHQQQALAVFREIGDRDGEAEALNSLGELFLATGQPGRARTHHHSALGLAIQIGDKYEQARAHSGLAQACHAAGEPGQARYHWQQALTRYVELGAPEANQVRTQLATANRCGDHELQTSTGE